MRGSKGFFFTVGVLLLLIPLIFLITYYISKDVAKADDVTGKIRCDELHYFVEDVNRDLSRAITIFGRRAAVYSVDYVVSTGNSLASYDFNCTSGCSVNCPLFKVDYNGSEAALTELVLCGTLFGENITYMANHTLSEWIKKMGEEGSEMNFNVSIGVNELDVLHYDAYNLAFFINLSFEMSDRFGMCFYEMDGITTESITSIVGLEDVLYALHTDADIIRYIANCSLNVSFDSLAGSSGNDWGNGNGGGTVFFASDIPQGERDSYCSDNDVSGLILVLTQGFGACNQIEQKCFNSSAPVGDHFEGAINEGPDNPQSFPEKCNISIPWISDTGGLNLNEGECTFMKNMEECGIHDVYHSISSNETNTTCYQVSDLSGYFTGCDEVSDGPSFLDRLDGNLNLSSRYANQTLSQYGWDNIGLETFIDPFELSAKGKIVNMNASWIDYLYWQNISGCTIPSICPGAVFPLIIDCPHVNYFRVDSSCRNVSGVAPVSQITSPEDQATLDGSNLPIILSGNHSDCDGTVTHVSVWIGGVEYNASIFNSTWNISWWPEENGSYRLTSISEDNEGFVEITGFTINVTVEDCCGGGPGQSSCSSHCISLGGYSTGTCRQNEAQCIGNGEVHESGGDLYCMGGPSEDTCCCLP